jgi:hypothetical protein
MNEPWAKVVSEIKSEKIVLFVVFFFRAQTGVQTRQTTSHVRCSLLLARTRAVQQLRSKTDSSTFKQLVISTNSVTYDLGCIEHQDL